MVCYTLCKYLPHPNQGTHAMQKVKLTFRHDQTDELYLEVEISTEFRITEELQVEIGVAVVRNAQQQGIDIYGVRQLVEF